MNKQVRPLLYTGCAVISLLLIGCSNSSLSSTKQTDFSMIHTEQDVAALFPRTATELTQRMDAALLQAQQQIDALVAVPQDKRSYATVARALDLLDALSDAAIMANACSTLEYVTTDDAVRTAAHDAVRKVQEFWVDAIENNVNLYHIFKDYVADVVPHEQLTAEQHYYLHEMLTQFKRRGLDLPDEQRTRVATLKKEIAQLSQDFEANIAKDQRTITVDVAGLAGVDADFIAQLKRTDDGLYILGVDYPTVDTIMSTCIVEATRKALYLAFNNRAHPTNQDVLQRLIAARDELASLLGMASFSELSLVDEMVASPERAHEFLQALHKRASVKAEQEFKELVTDLPAGITLTADGKLKPWDVSYVKNSYKKKYLAIDEEKIAEYFPMTSTVEGLLNVYKQFFNLTFDTVPLAGLWHDELRTLAVRDGSTHQLLGYLVLDLYPRPNKFTHACHITIVPSVVRDDGSHLPSVSVVLANFPRESATKPALFKRNDVSTFFHEFGHALHAILGRTEVASLSGTSVKRDFVEMPSQMLEEWLWDADILKQVSKHYKTGAPLSDELITKIQALKNFDSGHFVQRQAFLSTASLAYYGAGSAKDIKEIWRNLVDTLVPNIAYEPESHMYLSFGHLTGYGPRYYGYLWSKVFALDLFQTIKKTGLLNPEAGKHYVDQIIGRGGSKNPNELLKSYLGREPRQDAFFADLGL